MQHSLLSELKVDHMFGERTTRPALDVWCPRQVHGNEVAVLNSGRLIECPEADAVVSSEPGVRIGVVTADCVPILVALDSGRSVAAIHAGWRGLAAGVVESGIDALAGGNPPKKDGVAVVGPHIGPCCYEVDSPVIEALRLRYGDRVREATRLSRPDHVWLDLGALVVCALRGAGFRTNRIGHIPLSCTACHSDRYHSFRREGEQAGRMLHYIAAHATS